MNDLKMPLSNVQQALLTFFADDVPEEDLLEIKKILYAYRAKKMKAALSEAWEEKNYTADDMEKFLQTRMRTPYRSQDKLPRKEMN